MVLHEFSESETSSKLEAEVSENSEIQTRFIGMPGATRRYRLVNIQSWGPNSPWIELNEKGMHVLEARSETGKSVLFKMFHAAAFPPKSTRDSTFQGLLRRGKSEGYLDMEQYSGECIRFKIELKRITYYYKETKESSWKIFEAQALPEVIRKALGWVLLPESELILNLIEGDDAQLFIKTSNTTNAEVLSLVTKEKTITQAEENLMIWKQLVEGSMKKLAKPLTKLGNDLQATPQIDVDRLKLVLDKSETILTSWQRVDDMRQQLDYFIAIVNSKPDIGLIDWERAKAVNDSVSAIRKSDTALAELISIVSNRKEQLQVSGYAKEFDDESCRNVIRTLNKVNRARGALDSFMGIVESIPEGFNKAELDLPSLSAIASVMRSNTGAIKTISQFAMLVNGKPEDVLDPTIAEPILKSKNVTDTLLKTFRELVPEIGQHIKAVKGVRVLSSEIESLRQETGVCPLCGADMKGGMSDDKCENHT